jgi:hypothetical protein
VTYMSYPVPLHVVRSVINMSIKLYNNFPSEIRKADTFKDFKNKLRYFLLQHSFSCLEQFFSYRKSGVK